MKISSLILLLAALIFGVLAAGCAESPEAQPTPKDVDTSSSDTSAPDNAPSKQPVVEESMPEEPVEAAGSTADAPNEGELVGVLETTEGRIVVRFFPDVAPQHVAQFKKLINKGFYDGTRFHRCIPGFMIQGGDPYSTDIGMAGRWGTGGYTENGKEVNIPAEFNDIKHTPGILSTARSNSPNSASSQFFLMHADYPSLDGQYTVWGTTVEGLDVIDAIVNTGTQGGQVNPTQAVMIESYTLQYWPVE
jgi:peptidyl-prolyl cis-trans isomerase B (cyclophilin B)